MFACIFILISHTKYLKTFALSPKPELLLTLCSYALSVCKKQQIKEQVAAQPRSPRQSVVSQLFIVAINDGLR